MAGDRDTIGVPPNTKLMRVIRRNNGWILWLATRDYKVGTYLFLRNDGEVTRVTEREDDGLEFLDIRPKDVKVLQYDDVTNHSEHRPLTTADDLVLAALSFAT